MIDLSEALLEKETLEGAEVRAIVFPDGEPDYLKPKVVEEPFKFEAEQPVVAAEAPAADTNPAEENPQE